MVITHCPPTPRVPSLPTIRGHDNLHTTQIIKAIKLVQKLHPQMARSSGRRSWRFRMHVTLLMICYGKMWILDFGSFSNFFLVFTS